MSVEGHDDRAWLWPTAWAVISDKFDGAQGYGRLTKEVAVRTPRIPVRPVHPVIVDGYAVVPALSKATCELLIDRIETSEKGLLTAEILGKELTRSLLEELFEGPAGDAIRALYGPRFGALYVSARRAVDAQTSAARGHKINNSRWHCDGGPTAHARILVYLTPSDEHDSATWVADLKTTSMLKRAGYVHCRLDDRLEDLAPLCEQLGLPPFEAVRIAPEQGEALVFEPGEHLHRAELPSAASGPGEPGGGHRDSLHMGIIPTLSDWGDWFETSWEVVRANLDSFPPISVDV